MPLIEKQTDEIRTVHHMLFGKIPMWVTKVQRKWLVQSGKMYSPPNFGPPENKNDIFIDVIDGLPMWQPMKEVWKDIEWVGEKEASKQKG